MIRNWFCPITLTLSAMLILPSVAQAMSPPQSELGNNAALRYWTAFHFLPKFDEKRQALIDTWHEDKLDAAAATALLDEARQTLRYFHQGANIQPCDWGLNFDEGIELLLPYLALARDTARLAMLDARVKFDAGDTHAAIETAADVLALARHAGTHDILISILVQYSIENMVETFLTPRVDDLTSADRAYLAKRIDALPPGGSILSSVSVERTMGTDWSIRRLEAAKDRADWAQTVLRPIMDSDESFQKLVQSVDGSAEKLIEQLKALRPMYDELSAALALPPDKAHRKLAEISDRMEKNAAASLLLPAYVRVYDKHREAQRRLEQLKTTIQSQKPVKKGGK